MINGDTYLISYKCKSDDDAKPGNTNIGVAAMVTAYARMKLYRIMDSIESCSPGRVLYCDKDSVIYVDKPSEMWYNPPIGDYLGDMTDEITKDWGSEARIIQFASGGPKNYGFVVEKNGQLFEKIKVKGITLSDGTKDIMSFKTIANTADEYRAGNRVITEVPQQQFGVDKDHYVWSRLYKKKYRAVSDKGVVIQDSLYQLIPYGFMGDLYPTEHNAINNTENLPDCHEPIEAVFSDDEIDFNESMDSDSFGLMMADLEENNS